MRLNILYLILTILSVFSLSSCLEKKESNLISPCVASEIYDNDSSISIGNPCIRRKVNNWIL